MHKTGKVILAGAGPGDPDLLTVKAIRWIRKADVILADRLVSPEIISLYADPAAEVIHVGKQCGRAASTPQQSINQLLVEHATAGKLVVRLKGGDVAIFSNVLDELETLTLHGIPFEIVPGITAASGASAYAGIPLTARGFASAVRFLTFYHEDILPDRYWRELARTADTLVFYMSGSNLPLLAEKFTRYGFAPGKRFAIVDQATTPFQKVHLLDPYDTGAVAAFAPASPSLIIAGNVAQLHERFEWLNERMTAGEYFEEVTSPVVECAETEKQLEQLIA